MKKYFRTFEQFTQNQMFSAVFLFLCAVLALGLANSSWSSGYFQAVQKTQLIINDGLMPFFFLLVGLEIKRELVRGELASVKRAALPVIAALGGMVVPALLFVACNVQEPQNLHGWGIPMATDIAFTLGILVLLGPAIPKELRLFLSAVAIVDDLGAVFVIACFYTQGLHWVYLLLGAGVLVGLIAMNRFRVSQLWAYLMLGVLLWFCLLKSGIHPTIAGVLLAFCIPAEALLERLENRLHKPVGWFVLPLFALFNAGVSLPKSATSFYDPIVFGIVAGLVIGKVVGITGASWVCVRLKVAELPRYLSFGWLFSGSITAGIGFTMAFFISDLAFRTSSQVTSAKVGILTASVLAGLMGYLALRVQAYSARKRR